MLYKDNYKVNKTTVSKLGEGQYDENYLMRISLLPCAKLKEELETKYLNCPSSNAALVARLTKYIEEEYERDNIVNNNEDKGGF